MTEPSGGSSRGRLGRITGIIFFAARDVRKSKIVLLLIVVSLSVGFASIFLSGSISAGFQEMLIDGAIGYLGHIVITPNSSATSIPEFAHVLEVLRANSNVAAVSARSEAFTQIEYQGELSQPFRTVGMDNVYERHVTSLPERIIEGTTIDNDHPDKIVLGANLASDLVGQAFDTERVGIGETVTVTTSLGERKTYTVAGVIDAKTFLPNWFLIMPKREADSLQGTRQNVELVVKLNDAKLLEQTQTELAQALPDVHVTTWRQESGYIDDILQAVTFILGLMTALVTASVFVVMSIIIFINVFQKRRQIGILKSMGARNWFIVAIYVLEAMIYAVLSYGVGFLIFWTIYQYAVRHPVPLLIGDFSPLFIPSSLWFSLITLTVAGLGGSIVPAYVAAKTRIVNVIRDNV